MNVLVVGGGGREHAIVKALRRSGADVFAAMGNQNPGIRKAAKDVLVHDASDVPTVVAWAKARGVDLAVIGPEAPLAAGIVDALDAAGIPTVGPDREAARLETDKEFTRNLMREHKIRGLVDYWAFDRVDDFRKWLEDADIEFVIKPLGLTGGKGVRVWGDHFRTKGEAEAYAKEILEKEVGGRARFLVEEKVVGEEFSLQALCDGSRLVPTPIAQDHKRARENDEGPNTGGMGSYSDADHLLPFLTAKDRDAALATMRATVDAMSKRGTPFKGVLYGGFMATRDGVMLLEYNARFGDPEAMNVLPILEEDFLALCERLVDGNLPTAARFAKKATVCKYVVPSGYGTKPKAGTSIEVDEIGIAKAGAELFYASVEEKDHRVLTTTSRALAVVGVADSISKAEAVSEAGLRHVKGDVYVRHDIGTQRAIERKIERVEKLRSAA
ncbi:MAG: phosphoribosylamine--glycine ligase [Methanobacteriota archaeon]|nr:MAG: phosphoribosylamine--glycine ligase [Euryarchaeota archaeon]